MAVSSVTVTSVRAVEALMGTAISAQSALGIVHDMVIDVAPRPGAVLEPITTWSRPLAVVLVWRTVCFGPATVGAVVPTAPTTSNSGSPTALVVVTDGAVLVPIADTWVPSGVVWFTPVNDIEVAVTAPAFGAVTTTLWVPLGGATRYQISLRTVPFVEAPARVNAVPL